MRHGVAVAAIALLLAATSAVSSSSPAETKALEAELNVKAVTLPAEPAGAAPSCDGNKGSVTFSVSSSRKLGQTSTALPAEASAIKIVVTVPANRSGDGEACGLGDERVDAGTCPEKGECIGFTIEANAGTGLDACHGAAQTLGPYDWPLPQGGGAVKLLFNAVTEKVSTANVELTCKGPGRAMASREPRGGHVKEAEEVA